jgi:hypothetical protein
MPQPEMMMDTSTDDATSPAAREALARAQQAATRIPDDQLVAIRVDITDAALGVMGQVPTIEAHRAALVRIFGAEGTDALDALVPAARALMLANAALVAQGTRDLEPAAESLRKTRTRLFTLASVMVQRGVVDESGLADLDGGNAYVALVHDTQALVAWFHAHAVAIAPHSRVTSAELDLAEIEAEAFGRAVKAKARSGGNEASSKRARAFTYFVQSYDHVRKLVTYLRWNEGDADVIAPSIYAGRARSKDERDAINGPSGTPALLTPVAPGLPGGDPFIHS